MIGKIKYNLRLLDGGSMAGSTLVQGNMAQGSLAQSNPPEGKLIVLTGPSGVGKGTLLRSLLRRHPDLYLSISMTTRAPRAGELHGRDYYFVTRPEFDRMAANQQLLEWAEFAGNCYGTPRQPVEDQIRQGHWVVLEIELQGARQIFQSFPDALGIFILPPSMDELEQRLRQRASESEEAILRRLDRAKTEVNAADEFDIRVVNDDLEQALHQIELALFAPESAPESKIETVAV
jgi:guanylate kinase